MAIKSRCSERYNSKISTVKLILFYCFSKFNFFTQLGWIKTSGNASFCIKVAVLVLSGKELTSQRQNFTISLSLLVRKSAGEM